MTTATVADHAKVIAALRHRLAQAEAQRARMVAAVDALPPSTHAGARAKHLARIAKVDGLVAVLSRRVVEAEAAGLTRPRPVE
jgi:hypothetical protein